jgi:hypothetical protein
MSATMALTGVGHTAHHKHHPKSILMNCEETERTPCVTYDDGIWRKVSSYNPYRYQKINKCKTAHGGPKYPCAYPVKGTYRFVFFK